MEHEQDHSETASGAGPAGGQQPEAEEQKRAFDSFGEAMRSAVDEAASKAREAAPKMKSAVSDALHELTYNGTFGAVFLGTFAAELVPRNLRESMVKGAKAGREKDRATKDKVCDAMKKRPDAGESAEVTIDIEPDPAGA